MNIYPVQMNKLSCNKPSFKADFVHNQISKELLQIASKEDVAEFNAVCDTLKNNTKNQYRYHLSGSTSGYGVCSQSEVDDKFVALNYQESSIDASKFIRSWSIKTEKVVSGGYEKKNLLKEITKTLKTFATENNFKPKYNPADVIIKKATYVGKVL